MNEKHELEKLGDELRQERPNVARTRPAFRARLRHQLEEQATTMTRKNNMTLLASAAAMIAFVLLGATLFLSLRQPVNEATTADGTTTAAETVAVTNVTQIVVETAPTIVSTTQTNDLQPQEIARAFALQSNDAITYIGGKPAVVFTKQMPFLDAWTIAQPDERGVEPPNPLPTEAVTFVSFAGEWQEASSGELFNHLIVLVGVESQIVLWTQLQHGISGREALLIAVNAATDLTAMPLMKEPYGLFSVETTFEDAWLAQHGGLNEQPSPTARADDAVWYVGLRGRWESGEAQPYVQAEFYFNLDGSSGVNGSYFTYDELAQRASILPAGPIPTLVEKGLHRDPAVPANFPLTSQEVAQAVDFPLVSPSILPDGFQFVGAHFKVIDVDNPYQQVTMAYTSSSHDLFFTQSTRLVEGSQALALPESAETLQARGSESLTVNGQPATMIFSTEQGKSLIWLGDFARYSLSVSIAPGAFETAELLRVADALPQPDTDTIAIDSTITNDPRFRLPLNWTEAAFSDRDRRQNLAARATLALVDAPELAGIDLSSANWTWRTDVLTDMPEAIEPALSSGEVQPTQLFHLALIVHRDDGVQTSTYVLFDSISSQIYHTQIFTREDTLAESAPVVTGDCATLERPIIYENRDEAHEFISLVTDERCTLTFATGTRFTFAGSMSNEGIYGSIFAADQVQLVRIGFDGTLLELNATVGGFFINEIIISADSSQIMWADGDSDPDDDDLFVAKLWLADADGRNPRVIYEYVSNLAEVYVVDIIRPIQLLPDGHVLFSIEPSGRGGGWVSTGEHSNLYRTATDSADSTDDDLIFTCPEATPFCVGDFSADMRYFASVDSDEQMLHIRDLASAEPIWQTTVNDRSFIGRPRFNTAGDLAFVAVDVVPDGSVYTSANGYLGVIDFPFDGEVTVISAEFAADVITWVNDSGILYYDLISNSGGERRFPIVNRDGTEVGIWDSMTKFPKVVR